MGKHTLYIFTAVTAATLACGCVSPTPRIDSRFGDAMNIAKAHQTLNPDASAKRDVTRLDGPAAMAVFENYEKSYKTPVKPPSTFTIGVSGGQ